MFTTNVLKISVELQPGQTASTMPEVRLSPATVERQQIKALDSLKPPDSCRQEAYT
jgi:hypothetical protein